jgi:hypothetical protein
MVSIVRLIVMFLKVASGRLDLLASSIVCQLHDGTQTIVCTIARQVLRDLGDYHFGRVIPEEAVFSECLSEIERLANAKFRGRGLDENGGLSIGPADLVRYGFGGVLQFGIAAE